MEVVDTSADLSSAAGKVLADLDNGLGSLTAVDGQIDSPIDLTDTSADKVAAVDKALADPDIKMAMDLSLIHI